MFAARLSRFGFWIPAFGPDVEDTELRLYAMLREHYPDEAYPRYNGLVGRMASLVLALDARQSRLRRISRRETAG